MLSSTKHLVKARVKWFCMESGSRGSEVFLKLPQYNSQDDVHSTGMRPGATAVSTCPGCLSVLSTDSAGPSVLQHTGPERSQGHKARLSHSREVQSPGYPPSSTLHSHSGIPWSLPSWSLPGTYKPNGDNMCPVELLLGTPSEGRESTTDKLKGQLQQAGVLTQHDPPQNSGSG